MKTKHGRGNLVNPTWMREAERLHGRSSRDGRDRSYQHDEYDRRFDQQSRDERGGEEYPGMRPERGFVNRRELANMYNVREQYPQKRRWEEEEEDDPDGFTTREAEDDVRAEMEYRERSNRSDGTGYYGRGSNYMDEKERWSAPGLRNSWPDRNSGNDRNRYRNSERNRNY